MTIVSTEATAEKTTFFSGLSTSLLEALANLVEPALLRFSRRRRLVAVEIDENDLAFHWISGRAATFIGKASTLGEKERRFLLSKRSCDVELRLSAERGIVATFRIPADGLAYTRQIVESRLDRLTPWQAEALLFGYSTAASEADGQVEVDFAATSRAIAAASIARLETYGLRPSRMGFALRPVSERLRIDLFQGENDTAAKRRRRRIGTVAVVLPVIFLAIYATSLYFALQSASRIEDLDNRLAAVRRQLVGGSGSITERQRDTALIASKIPEDARFFLIDRLATIIPETTVLSELDIQNDVVRIAGTSTEASGLIRILELEPFFSNAKFAAPVTRQDDGRDRFDITTQHAVKSTEAKP